MAEPEPERKTCAANPAHTFTRRPGLAESDWRRQTTCDRRCASQLGLQARRAIAAAKAPLAPRQCDREGCTGMVRPRPGERPANFRRRRYDTRRCSALAGAAARGHGKPLVPASRICACGCGATVVPAKRESQARWDRHLYATKGCANHGRARNRIPEDQRESKLCGCGCGKTFTRDPSRVDRATFAARKYASHECSARARRTIGSTGRAQPTTSRRARGGRTQPATKASPGARKAAERAVDAGAAVVQVLDPTPSPEPTWRPASWATRDSRPRCDHGRLLGQTCTDCAETSAAAA